MRRMIAPLVGASLAVLIAVTSVAALDPAHAGQDVPHMNGWPASQQPALNVAAVARPPTAQSATQRSDTTQRTQAVHRTAAPAPAHHATRTHRTTKPATHHRASRGSDCRGHERGSGSHH